MKNERLVHRLEAFSDIVMGFVLAETAISLAVPKHVPTSGELLSNLLGFAATFGLVAIVWTLHTRLFALYFVPNILMMLLNFIMLGGLVMMGYIFSLAMRFAGMPGAGSIMGAWLYCFAAVYVLLAAMYGIGSYLRRAELTQVEFSSGIERFITSTIGSVALFAVGSLFSRVHHVREINGLLPYAIAVGLCVVAMRLVRRFLAARRPASG